MTKEISNLMCQCLPLEHRDMHPTTWIGITGRQRLTLHYGMLCQRCRNQKLMSGIMLFNDREALRWIRSNRFG